MYINICGKKTLLLIEKALCAPSANVALKRFLASSNMSRAISVHSPLLLQILNALLHIQVMGPYLHIFHEQHTNNAINFWYNSKEQRINQLNNRTVRAAQVVKPKHVCFDVNQLSLPLSSSSSNSEDD